MKSLGSHLAKYTKLGAPQKAERDVCREVVETHVGVSIGDTACVIKNEVLFVSVSAPVKMKVREMKREILAAIRKKLGNVVRDIA